MNEVASRGLLTVNRVLWLPSGLAEKISVWFPTLRAKEIRPFLPLKVAAEGPAAIAITTMPMPSRALVSRATSRP